jgi:hypothetical protein
MQPFDPEQGETIFTPEASEKGYWVGCPGVLYEPAPRRFLLTYRQRRPRGATLDRGWRCAVAESADGRSFKDIWSVTKDQLSTPSMERFSLFRATDGRYRLYISYVDPVDNRWRIDSIEANSPDGFRLEDRVAVFTADSTNTEGIKDPYTVRVGQTTYLFATIARARAFTQEERSLAHATADIHNTGLTTAPTGLAVSEDEGGTWSWQGEALAGGDGWDAYECRLNSVFPMDEGYVGFYDGSATVEENYEEHCGLAVSSDLREWRRLTVSSPWVVSPHASGSLRYEAAVRAESEVFLYYEYARPGGAHELRLSRFPEDEWHGMLQRATASAGKSERVTDGLHSHART